MKNELVFYPLILGSATGIVAVMVSRPDSDYLFITASIFFAVSGIFMIRNMIQNRHGKNK